MGGRLRRRPRRPRTLRGLPPRQRRRFRRDHHEDEGSHEIDLGDRLSQKLQNLKMEIQYEIGNYSCMLRECGVFDSANNFQDVETLVAQMNEYPVRDKWLKNHIEEDVRMCHSVSILINFIKQTSINILIVRKLDFKSTPFISFEFFC